ncbi:MAG: hypothetical protein ACR2OY_09805, partial [Boseongicola sp.]
MFTGRPIDWGLQEKVALIPNDEWARGPDRISELIAEFERDRRGAPDTEAIETERAQSGEALKRHVQRLLEQSAAAEVNATGLAWQIKSAINEYCNEHGPNETPEELKPFEAIADVLARIGETLDRANIEGQEEGNVSDDLETEIAELQLRLKALEAELADAQSKMVTGLISRGFYIGIGTSLSVACTTAVLSAGTYFIAPEYAPDIVRQLGDRFMALFEKPPLHFPQVGVE